MPIAQSTMRRRGPTPSTSTRGLRQRRATTRDNGRTSTGEEQNERGATNERGAQNDGVRATASVRRQKLKVQSLAIPRHRTLTDNERMLGRRRSACEEGDAVGRGRRNSKADIKRIRIFAYNRPGQHMVSRESDVYRRKETGNGKDLATTPSEAMACVINMMNDHRGDLGVISESTTTVDERAAVIGRWDLEG